MNPARRVLPFALGLLLAHAASAGAQTTLYHLHREPTDDFFTCGWSLKTTGPDAATLAIQSADLKNKPIGVGPVACFQTFTNPGGTIPPSSTVTFALWMKKTANWGVIYPQAELRLKSGAVFCSAIGTAPNAGPIATSFPSQAFTFSCTTPPSPIVMSATDPLRLYVGYSIATVPGNHSVKVELDLETSFDSQVTAPTPLPPAISNIAPSSGPGNWPITVTGTNFGTSGTLKFGTTPATTVTTWTNTSIVAQVPTGLNTGPAPLSVNVTVTTGGVVSNTYSFSVIAPSSVASVTPALAHHSDTVTIAGANFLATQGTSTVTFFNGAVATTTSWSDTAIVATVPSTATTGPVVVRVSGQDSNGVTFTLIVPGTVAGTITQAGNGNPLSGASVQAVFQGVIKATGTTPADGSYSLSGLDPGTYDLRVYATGYSAEVRSASIASETTTPVSVAMYHPGTIAGTVTQSDGITPIAGAAVTVFSGPIQKGSTSTNGTGDYSIASLHPGTLTVQAVNVGNRTKEQSAVVSENATTTANLSLDGQPAGPVTYAYDAIGRLIQVTDPSGDAAIYRYDPVGNITAIERPGATVVSISGFTPTSGAVGTSVTIFGTGFSTTPGQNTVTFGCGTNCTVNATVTSAASTQLAVTVPSTAMTSAIAVTAQSQTATAPASFTVTSAGAAPTIASFTPALTVAGSTLTVTGTDFDSTLANNRLTTNVASAQVTSASPTSLQATVPVTSTGRVSVTTQNGSVTSTDYLWVAPAPYIVGNVDSTGPMAFNTDTDVVINSAGKFLMRAFDGTQGNRASVRVTITNASFPAGGTVAIYGAYADPTSIGWGNTGFLEPVALRATGTYTLLFAPNGTYAGTATLTVYDVPPDQAGPIVPGSSTPIAIEKPGQNARFTFAGTANDRVCLSMPTPAIAGGLLKLLRPDGTALGSMGFNSGGASFLDTLTLASTGTYTVLVDPATINTGTASVTLHSVPADTTGPVSINGSAVAVPLAIGQNGSLTFTGTQNQTVTVHATGNTFGSGSVVVKLLSSDGQTVLSQSAIIGASTDLSPATLPTAGTATYTILIDPTNAATGTLNISVSGS